ncbi:MAG: AAA family ATPase, partial [Dysgonamonadaceae bacterium]|nr:AAA family ATPase [Dysgonamonadaceae bacterium]
MDSKTVKKLPYGISNFGVLATGNYAYVDKTQFIEIMEKEGNPNHFFIRPRKFGKSLFFSMLSYYYDINLKNDFDKYFGNLYIGKNPTPERNSYAMLTFDFSGLDTSGEEEFKKSFSQKVEFSVRIFLNMNTTVFPDAKALMQ